MSILHFCINGTFTHMKSSDVDTDTPLYYQRR